MTILADKKVIVIGGAGFIGSHLVDRMADNVRSLAIVDAFVEHSGANDYHLSKIDTKKVKVVRENLKNVDSWGELLNDADVIFNLASVNAHKESMADPFADYHRNAAVHLKLIRFCQTLNRPLKIIFTSSRSVYGSALQNPTKETDPCYPRDFYSMHTLLAEHYYRMSGGHNVKVCCVRFSNTFGPRMRLRGKDIGLFGELLKSAFTHQPMEIYGTGETLRDTLFVDNLIEGLLLVAGKHDDTFSVVNIGGIGISILQFAEAIKRSIPSASILFRPLPEHMRSIQVGDVILDNTIAVQKYQWTPTLNLEESIQRTVDFYKTHKDNYM